MILTEECIKEIYEKFMQSDRETSSNFFENYDLKFSKNKGFTKKKLSLYVKGLSIEEQEEYNSKNNELINLKREYVIVIEQYKSDLINGIMPDFSKLQPEKDFFIKVEKYLNFFPKEKEFVINLLKKYDEYKMQANLVFNVVDLLNEEYKPTNIVKTGYFSNQYNYTKEEVEFARETIKDLLLSGYSIEDYCHLNINYNIKSFTEIINRASNNNRAIKIAIKQEIEKRETKLVQKAIIDVLDALRNNNFDIVDYYMITKLSLYDFDRLARTLFENNMNINRFTPFFTKFKSSLLLQSKNTVIKVIEKNLLDGGISETNNCIITREKKQEIIDFMKKTMPLDEKKYLIIIRRLARGQVIEDKITGETLSIDSRKSKKINL